MKPSPIDLEIKDQIPVSMRDDIEVSVLELSDGELDEETAIVTWSLQIPAGETLSVLISYDVSHSSGGSVYLD